MTKIVVLPGLALMLSACNYLGGEDGMFRERGGDYSEAQIVPAMSIPAELDSYTLDQLYVIPERANLTATTFAETPLPKPIESRRREGVIIQSLSGESWVLIDATPGQVWPMIRDYWTELQIQLDYENPGNGLMETAWLEIGSNSELRHKYRIRIEPGLHSGYSEIYLVHLQNQRDDPIPTVINWPEDSNDPELEREVMTSISQYLADRNDIYQASSASLLAGSIEAASKANIVQAEDGEQILELRVGIDRAWVQIRQAIVDAEIEILDSNRDQSVITVRFAGISPEEDEPGFVGRLLRRGNTEEEVQPRDFSVRLMETGSTINVVTEVLDANSGEAEGAPLSADLLQVINENLG
ncbi:MAG: outer membrane protein assembly factor BamC [Gammaproteobacteria bacterium]